MNDLIVMILSIMMFFGYQVKIFKYAIKILVDGTKKLWNIYLLALINTVLFLGYNNMKIPVSGFFFLAIVVLCVEFRMLSKANILQCVCGASVFMMHIAAIYIPTLMILSHVMNVPSTLITGNNIYSAIVLLVSCVLLALVILPYIEKKIDVIYIQRVTTAGRHTVLLLSSTLVSVLYLSIQTQLLISDEMFGAQIVISLASGIYLLGAFYVLLMYGITIVNAKLYKRKSDAAIDEQEFIEKTKEKLYDKITKDALTSVYNRRYVMNLLDEFCEAADYQFGVLFVDVNGVKYVNDTYGHEAGDRLIISIADAISESVRDSDVVARIGGDEFLVILDETIDARMKVVIERIEHNITMKNQSEEINISASVGMVVVDDTIKQEGREHILAMADSAMRESKELFYQGQEEA